MIHWREWCLKMHNSFVYEKITLISFIFIIVVLSFDCIFQNLPLSGYGIIFLSLLCSLFVSLCVGRGFKCLQGTTKFDELLKKETWLAVKAQQKLAKFVNDLFLIEIGSISSKCSVNEQIRLLIKDIEKDYVKSWYCEISTNPSFLFDSHLILEEIIYKFFYKLKQFHVKFCIRNLLYIYLGHLQELKRSLRRASNSEEVGNVYRSCHPGSMNDRSLNHYLTNVMDIVVRENAPHDLASSLQCSIIIRILARKLLKTIIVNVEDPMWIYSRLLHAVDIDSYLLLMAGGSYFVKEQTQPEPEAKKKFQVNPLTLSRKNNLEGNIFHRALGTKAFASATGRCNDKNMLSLPLVNSKAEPNISSVLGNLISSTAAPLLPEHASLCYQPLNKMWLSPSSEIKHDVNDGSPHPTDESIIGLSTANRNQMTDDVFSPKRLTRSKSTDTESNDGLYQPLTKKDISFGEDLAEGLNSTVDVVKKLIKTKSFDEGSSGDLAEASEEKTKDGDVSPVYEEPEDFASTIAKLRNVLQQRESTSTTSECSNKSMESQDTFSRDNTMDRADDGSEGPQAASDVPSDGRPFVDVRITGTEVKESSSSAYVLYTIEYNGIYLRNSENGESQLVLQPTTIKRRFQEFLNLQARLEENSALKPYLKGIKGPTKWLSLPFNTKTDEATTATRKPVLERYLGELCDRIEIACSQDLQEFLAYGSALVTAFHSPDSNSSIHKIDKYLSNKVTGVFNSIKTVLPSFEGNFVADAKEVKEMKPAAEQNLLQGFLNFGNKSEDVSPVSLNFLYRDSTGGEGVCDAVRRMLAHKSECIEDALDVLDSSDWHSQQGECHAAPSNGPCVWTAYHRVLHDDELDVCEESPLVHILIDILSELLADTDCWLTKQPVVENLKKIASYYEIQIQERLCRLEWDRICGNVLRMLRTAVFSQQTSHSVQLDFDLLHSTLVSAIISAMPVLVTGVVGRDCLEAGVRNLLNSFRYPTCNRDLLLRLSDVLLSQLLSCPHLLPPQA